MNTRSMILMAALALLGAGLVMTLLDLFDEAPAPPRVTVAVAASAIEPYTIVTEDMVKAGASLPVDQASAKGAWPVDAAVGKMSTARLTPGSMLTGLNLKPIEEVRFVEDLGLEVVSFAAGVDRLVGGQLRPGHLVNLYGIGRDQESNENYTTLIEPRLWVVGVSSSGQPVDMATPRPRLSDGAYVETRDGRDRNGTMITIAVEPERAYRVIDALGAQGLSAWVTLAASHVASLPATATPEPPASEPVVDIWATLQAIATAELYPTPPIAGYGGAAAP